ncbi:Sorting nexin, cytoplasm-to-vacuole targeting pathway/endosomal sorting [Exophiala dermatitidis]|uniref:Sorting nexin, cytoplasm-to-vacuole targeting pathway/endosomal sorting n=1 Tax=Exophiala dermatitidis TaxID=5970 RepID=A0AAN6EUJ1_EXODE|nr:Sorting nexin, cytoplasm-to-vacuole targeting pathway/endosomal sorting [Exophiala dermatitidis]KAJ4515920.1 Sorting nexin, cytoplasm-to-vacuole targeting pathway/endosomal sorting [Exophiala dermatitidis]KAJ4518673.1 Sorting nexin, cytoplasm-to-vacuole targeting pathway/endosomal sorting [Exophiala dermatitidis]KAJ4534186.1 Sorting nexin, cytoplasm-to-vacuole targeting pathway/endosomal sorting [Exophiala dermatitidis]KAJ4545916.1 Sorting nexin, cytoplasm-to-vacuole targeting pathway/endoso
MWQDDEDNNPYGSFDNQEHSAGPTNPALSASYSNDSSPPRSSPSSPDQPPQFLSRPDNMSDDEDDDYNRRDSNPQPVPTPPRGGYDSRVQQILYENPDLEIVITDAGKSSDGGYIVYKIRTGDIEVARRYSEFSSLRAALVNLHPTLVIPPIPEKHTMADYAAKPTKAKEDVSIIDLRKRMLGVFLNRCRRMKEVVEDGVWWRFLDPNSSWNEVLHAHPISSIPKNNLKAPPLNPANPTPAHNWLPVPSSSAKLKSTGPTSSSGTPISPPDQTYPSAASHTTPGPQIFGRFPIATDKLSETDLDPYFINFEASTRELELLLQGSIEKVNRRTLEHLTKLSADLAELGARYNGFSLSEQSPTVAAAIERIGQAVDSTYISTEELALSLGANFAEPMRESAQFAGVVRNVLRYRVLKRVQQDMTRDDLEKKRNLLESLERSEAEAKRIDAYLSGSTAFPSPPRRSASNASARSVPERQGGAGREGHDETESVDSDFPPTHGETPSSPPSAAQGQPNQQAGPASPISHKKSPSGNFVANKIFGSFRHAVNGFVDVDPERTRRDQIGKTRESLTQLEQALEVSEKDVKDATQGVLRDLKRFQKEKEDDLQRYMIAYARCHIEWARKNLETWSEARDEVDKIVAR